MGNCVRKGSSSSSAASKSKDIKFPVMPRETHYSEKIKVEEDQGEKVGREIKIKITKKQLEELLGKVEVQGLPVQLLLAELIRGKVQDQDDDEEDSEHQRSWRPTLQSIPE